MKPAGDPFNGEVPEQLCVKNDEDHERNEALDNNGINIGSNLVYVKEKPLFYLDAEYLADSVLREIREGAWEIQCKSLIFVKHSTGAKRAKNTFYFLMIFVFLRTAIRKLLDMPVFGKTKMKRIAVFDAKYKVKEFSVYSWQLEEYMQAVQYDEIYQSVKENLDIAIDKEPNSSAYVSTNNQNALVESKFYYAGGNCELMFAYKTKELVSVLGQAIRSLSDISPILGGDSCRRSPDAINRLLIYPPKGTDSNREIVQIYWTKFTGPEFVRQLASKLRPRVSASLNGWMYNLWFIYNLRTQGVTIYDENRNFIDFWKRSNILVFSDLPDFPDHGIWLTPVQKNHGGFDGVFVDKSKGYVRFIIIPHVKEHEVKFEYFKSFLKAVLQSPSSFELKKLEIMVIVQRYYRSDFKLSLLPSTESLEEYGIENDSNLPAFLWVKYENWSVTKIPTAGCEIVAELKGDIIKRLKLKLSPGDFGVHVDANGAAVRPYDSLEEAFYDHETKTWFGVSDENPLIAKDIQTEATEMDFPAFNPLNYKIEFPFFVPNVDELVWDAASFDDSRVRNNKNEIQKLCAKLVPNLDINDLYMGFDRMISKDVINLGSSFERMFASALAAKYYLYCLRNQAYVENGYVTFSELYDGVVPDRKTKEILQQCSLNLTCGIVPDKMEHPNLVLQSNQGLISVISKDSLLLGGDDIKKQMFTRRGSNEKGLPFIFLYLENDEKEDRYDDSVIYLDGGGCCSSIRISHGSEKKMAYSNRNNFNFETVSMLPAEVGSVVQVDGLYHAVLSRKDQSKKFLYCRNDTLAQLSALNEMQRGLQISGPPGSGKSVTTWLWACHNARVYGKTVLWIHCGTSSANTLLLITKNGIERLILAMGDQNSYIAGSRSDIVVVDGVTRQQSHDGILAAAFSWQFHTSRRSVFVASMNIRTKPAEDRIRNISKFVAEPWSHEEFYAAVSNDDLFEQVEPFLLEIGEEAMGKERSTMSRQELVIRKCFYSGNSARWTLGTSISDVIEAICYYIRRVPYFIGMLNGYVGEATEDNVFQLMLQYYGWRFFLSEYIARKVLGRGGAEAVRLAYNIIKLVDKPSLTDWVLVSDFISQVIAARKRHLNVVGDSWPVSYVITDSKMESVEFLQSVSDQLVTGCWILPEKWNPGSYDLVSITCVDTLTDDGNMGKFVVHFIQVAKSSGNTIDLKHFEAFASCLMDALDCEIVGVEIVLMTPDNANFDVASLMIKSTGRLASFNVGTTDEKWIAGNEESNVKIKQFVKTR
ncbi:hypothetical protein MP638_001397 [Amoeboaphelidium occidentale]|nr:hypothetical protein MP638_001397 [Amoeboaphelidium occidentale]